MSTVHEPSRSRFKLYSTLLYHSGAHPSSPVATVTGKPGWVSVLAPVSDSLGDIVALVEAVSQKQLDSHENVK